MINNILYVQPNSFQFACSKSNQISFEGGFRPETLKYTNIGSCMEGYIGKIRLRKGDNIGEYYANVFKNYIGHNAEHYSVCDDSGNVLGEVNIEIRKYQPGSYYSYDCSNDPSHVFVDNLRNYTNPKTPYYKQGLEYLKDIGTRLLQIAQRRSDEAQCVGNIKLVSKEESKAWYKNVIGMVEEFPPDSMGNSMFKFCVHNPNLLILPPHAKEPLSRLQGGL